MVGSVSLYDFNADTAEIGKILIGDPEAHGRGIGRLSLLMAMKIGFQQLDLKRIVASVHQENIPSRSNFIRIGVTVIGNHPSIVGGLEDEVCMNEPDLCSANPYYPDIRLGAVTTE